MCIILLSQLSVLLRRCVWRQIAQGACGRLIARMPRFVWVRENPCSISCRIRVFSPPAPPQPNTSATKRDFFQQIFRTFPPTCSSSTCMHSPPPPITISCYVLATCYFWRILLPFTTSGKYLIDLMYYGFGQKYLPMIRSTQAWFSLGGDSQQYKKAHE